MGRTRPGRAPSPHYFLFALLVGLILLISTATTGASYVSRRQAIQRNIAEVHAGQPKHYRIGVKQMPPMCFYDPSLPEDQQFSGVRGNPQFQPLKTHIFAFFAIQLF